jgi:nucleoside 2-deoxyribosyltransferase
MTVVCRNCCEKRANSDVILYSDYAICAHCVTYYENVDDKKKRRRLNECDVYIFNVSEVTNVSGRLIEWGKACALDKIVLVRYDPDVTFFSKRLFETLVNDSKRSLRHISKQMRDAIIANHYTTDPLSLRTYKEYKRYLENYNVKDKEELI